jgi:hypothetical protein
MNTSHPKIYFLIFLLLSNISHGGAKNVGGVVGSIRKSIAAGSPSAPVYSVASASVVNDAVYSGQILNVNSSGVTFETSSDESEAAINPFISGVFHQSNRTPILTSSLSGTAVGSISITYEGIGFSTAPEIIIDYPSDGDDQATATCTLSNTGIGSISITNAGSGYSSAPDITVVGGPHLLQISESGDTNEGMFFRILDNNSTGLVLDTSRLPTGDSLSDYLSPDLSVEVVAAPTIASVMGRTASTLPANFNSSSAYGSSVGADFIYLFNRTVYVPYCFMPQSGSNMAAWYSPSSLRRGHRNDVIIYPDEGFIISKRTSGALDIDFDGGAKTSSQKMKLPSSDRAVCMNNPYGTDMLLGEIIPPKLIGSGNSKFNTGSSDTDTNADILYFLVGTEWKQFYYKTGVNHTVTRNATATAKAGTGGSGALADVDVSLAGGAVSNLQSCNSAGSTSIDHNISEYTKVTLTGTAPAVGFNIDFSGFFGRKLDGLGNGTHEVDVNGTRVNPGSGIFFRSGLNGTYKVIARPSSTSVVVKKKRDIHFVATKKSSAVGSGPKWSTGQGGAGYNGNAKAYFMGGGNTTMAIATAIVSSGAVTGFNFSGTGNTRGAGYTYAPQVVICSGGWRKVGAANPNNVIQDGQVLDATEGIVIIRKGTTRTVTYFQPKNPFN